MPLSQMLYHIIIRVPKNESSFLYFILEANEGLAFYSTLDHIEGQTYRDVEISTAVEFKADLQYLIKKLSHNFSIEYLVEEEIPDQIVG